ncbi:Fanconi anemia group J protein isoform X2 [Betta splendens]|uniref:DNA 5'-3' helicase n=1 Tax=Betta splendens TaxID=158456 RepID=A0A8M1HLS2_BETSP|nr:Fanconi anemia group J protein isoform X2 [Betta splendens]
MAGVEYTIGGVKIHFPCKAYPSQLAMMNAIIRGLNSECHCLLESPTGSGKSLALLCSALGWQQAQCAKLKEAGNTGPDMNHSDEKSGDDITPCQSRSQLQHQLKPPVSSCMDANQQLGSAAESMSQQEEPQTKILSPASRLTEKFRSSPTSDCEKDNDFLPERKRMRTPDHKSRKRQRVERGVIFIDDDPELDSKSSDSQNQSTQATSPAAVLSPSCNIPETCPNWLCDSDNVKVKGKDGTKGIPKIFFGTRTHKQITQIAHELQRTAYSSVPMTILSSRDHTCVNPMVAPHSSRNERCKDLLEAKDGRSCRYYHGVHKMRDQYVLQSVHGLSNAWDIEDLVALGKRLRSCSYYAARELKQNASIIFCPYNYLLDPLIRESMEINLSGQILVLDEAHNIEDCARESASFTLDHKSLLMCRDELEGMVTNDIRATLHEPLRNFCYSLINWVQKSRSLMSDGGYEVASKVWSGKDVLNIFHTLGITADTFSILKQKLKAVLEKEECVRLVSGKEEMMPIATISSAASTVLKSLFMILDFLYREECRFAEDYRVALQKSYAWMNQNPPDVPDAQGFIARPGRQRHSVRVKAEVLTLSFWCLNPAVAFSDLKGIRSILLTSGTLSPMGSFASELGVKFPIQLEANHVINKSQVWVGTVGTGPLGRKLCATYQHTETYAFQDEVGALLHHVCQIVAKGVLCFLPSYKMLDKLRDRWTNTGLWKKLELKKAVITEPRGGAKGDFDDVLQTYYDAVKYCNERDGALLIAVCRGKVSEGLDFTDDNARAVVTIGIPFPNIRDLQVELKIKYNDQHCKTRGLLPGHRWYEIQAYRALNQALGRCIRHKNDWGALILVDDRYRTNPNKYITGLSKWVRHLVQHHDTFSNAMQSLAAFYQVQQNAQAAPVASQTTGSAASAPHCDLDVQSQTQQQQDSPFTDCCHVQSEPEPNKKAEPLQKMQTLPAQPHSSQKRPSPPLYPIFCSSPVSTSFKRPIFKEKALCNSKYLNQHSETTSYQSELKVQQQMLVTQEETETHVVKHGKIISENQTEPHKVTAESSTPTTTPGHEGESPAADDENETEDQSVFFTPELFESKGDESSPLTETEGLVLGSGGSTLPLEDVFCFEQGHRQQEADRGSRQSAISASEVRMKLSLGQADEMIEREEGQETVPVLNLIRRTGSRLCRLSRSRQRSSSTPTGN